MATSSKTTTHCISNEEETRKYDAFVKEFTSNEATLYGCGEEFDLDFEEVICNIYGQTVLDIARMFASYGVIQMLEVECDMFPAVPDTFIPPEEWTCPITYNIMRNPVDAPDGKTYERNSIIRWIEERGTSPFTRQQMTIGDLVVNTSLRETIIAGLQEHQ